MIFRMLCFSVIFLLFPVAAFSQQMSVSPVSGTKMPSGFPIDFYRSTRGLDSLGISISFLEDGKVLGGNLAIPIDERLQAFLGVGLGLFDDLEINGNFKGPTNSIPPSPIAAAGMVLTSDPGKTGLQSFLSGSFNVISMKAVRDVPLVSIVGLTAQGVGGVFKRLEVSSEWVAIPFLGVSYAYTWAITDNKISDVKETTESDSFSGLVGLELELAPELSVWGSLTFSFDSSDTIVK